MAPPRPDEPLDQISVLHGPGAGGAYRVGLTRRSEFVEVGKGRRVHAGALTLQVAGRQQACVAESRFGLTVTRRVGNAVERNRIKRRLRAALATGGLAPQPGHDYVVVARRAALTMTFDDLVADLAGALERSRHGRQSRPRGEKASRASRDPVQRS